MSRKVTIPSSCWGTRQAARAKFGISREKLLEWTTTGIVRSVKFSDGKQQGRRVFCHDDIAAALERLAVGLEPEVRRR
jgi:hypothetical protein